MKNDNYIVISGWMVSELNLKGNELLVYAIVYGFSQTDGQEFTGGLDYLMDWTGTTKNTVLGALQSLCEKGLLTKRVFGRRCAYSAAALQNGAKIEPLVDQNGAKIEPLKVQKLHHKGAKIAPNNIDIILDDNIEYIKERITKKESRHKYGEYKNVLLSDKQLEKLKAEFPSDWEERIEKVSRYCASHGKTYKDYLATIRNWARRDKGGGGFVSGELPF